MRALEKGTSTVEFAIVVLAMIFVFVAIETGLIYYIMRHESTNDFATATDGKSLWWFIAIHAVPSTISVSVLIFTLFGIRPFPKGVMTSFSPIFRAQCVRFAVAFGACAVVAVLDWERHNGWLICTLFAWIINAVCICVMQFGMEIREFVEEAKTVKLAAPVGGV